MTPAVPVLLLSALLLPAPSLQLAVYHLDPNPHTMKEINVSPTVTVATDPTGKLPAQFSICVSFHVSIRSRALNVPGTPGQIVMEVRGDPSPRNPSALDEGLYLRNKHLLEYSTMKNTGFISTEGAIKSMMRYGSVVMEDWVHICTSVDAVTGDVLVVVNGDVALNEKNEYLENSEDKKPESAINSTWFYGENYNPHVRH
jgi:hypothetical protein